MTASTPVETIEKSRIYLHVLISWYIKKRISESISAGKAEGMRWGMDAGGGGGGGGIKVDTNVYVRGCYVTIDWCDFNTLISSYNQRCRNV